MRIPTSDGGFGAAGIYRPAGQGPFPTLYAVSPYGKEWVDLPATATFRHRETGDIAFRVANGYAYVPAGTRGTGHSTSGSGRSVRRPNSMTSTTPSSGLLSSSGRHGRQPDAGNAVQSALRDHYARMLPSPANVSI